MAGQTAVPTRGRGRGTECADRQDPRDVPRDVVADAPNRLWLTDITEHPTREGKVYCAAVLDVYSRRIVGWSIADHLRAELVVDALEMARWRRRPPVGQTLASALDNSMMESFFGTMQRELLDRPPYWSTRKELASAMFEWIEGWYNPRRRHTSIGGLSPVDYERSRQAPSHAA